MSEKEPTEKNLEKRANSIVIEVVKYESGRSICRYKYLEKISKSEQEMQIWGLK